VNSITVFSEQYNGLPL